MTKTEVKVMTFEQWLQMWFIADSKMRVAMLQGSKAREVIQKICDYDRTLIKYYEGCYDKPFVVVESTNQMLDYLIGLLQNEKDLNGDCSAEDAQIIHALSLFAECFRIEYWPYATKIIAAISDIDSFLPYHKRRFIDIKELRRFFYELLEYVMSDYIMDDMVEHLFSSVGDSEKFDFRLIGKALANLEDWEYLVEKKMFIAIPFLEQKLKSDGAKNIFDALNKNINPHACSALLRLLIMRKREIEDKLIMLNCSDPKLQKQASRNGNIGITLAELGIKIENFQNLILAIGNDNYRFHSPHPTSSFIMVELMDSELDRWCCHNSGEDLLIRYLITILESKLIDTEKIEQYLIL